MPPNRQIYPAGRKQSLAYAGPGSQTRVARRFTAGGTEFNPPVPYGACPSSLGYRAVEFGGGISLAVPNPSSQRERRNLLRQVTCPSRCALIRSSRILFQSGTRNDVRGSHGWHGVVRCRRAGPPACRLLRGAVAALDYGVVDTEQSRIACFAGRLLDLDYAVGAQDIRASLLVKANWAPSDAECRSPARRTEIWSAAACRRRCTRNPIPRSDQPSTLVANLLVAIARWIGQRKRKQAGALQTRGLRTPGKGPARLP